MDRRGLPLSIDTKIGTNIPSMTSQRCHNVREPAKIGKFLFT